MSHADVTLEDIYLYQIGYMRGQNGNIKKIPQEFMDKSYKKLIVKEKALEKDTKKVLAKDKSRDKEVNKAKKMKAKC
jgi:hypothetical protein